MFLLLNSQTGVHILDYGRLRKLEKVPLVKVNLEAQFFILLHLDLSNLLIGLYNLQPKFARKLFFNIWKKVPLVFSNFLIFL